MNRLQRLARRSDDFVSRAVAAVPFQSLQQLKKDAAFWKLLKNLRGHFYPKPPDNFPTQRTFDDSAPRPWKLREVNRHERDKRLRPSWI